MTGRGIEAQLSQCGLQVTDCNYDRQQQNHPAEPRQPTGLGEKEVAVVSAAKFSISYDQRMAAALIRFPLISSA